MKKISLHLPSSAFVGRGHMIWKHEDLLRRWSEPSSPARIWCFCWRRNSEMELVLGKSGLSCRLEWLMSRWTNDAVPCQGCSPRSYVMGNCQRLSPITDLSCLTQYDFLTLFWKFQKIPWFVWATRDSLPTMQETQVWSLGREDPLEKETATHSSTLAYKIPWMEEPGGLQSLGSQRAGHDWVTSLSLSVMSSLVNYSMCKHLHFCQFFIC